MAELTSKQVWNELKREIFAVLGMVTTKGEARTVGVVYIVHDGKLYISTGKESWKARHVRGNPHVSITVPIAKRIPIMPWIKIPAATITFSGTAQVLAPEDLKHNVLHMLFRGLESDKEMLAETVVLEIEPKGEFVTYGIGIPLMQMRFPEKSRGRAPVI
ncbi:MAG: pyridoxamine 5'-phosphate oxidase family protein [Anaerolineales bacterium]|jgi:nitroimidazol reductase NimA-like FMN-containing flavoprotein (pyridoxamine 5'-phosphate oxidase superfamily)